MSDYISRADAIDALKKVHNDVDVWEVKCGVSEALHALEALPSADAVPKWNCTANFVAEQLDRLRKMTDEEKWEFFKRFFDIKGGDDE